MLTFWAYTIIFFIINQYIATVRSVLKLQNAVKLKKMLLLIIIKHFQLYIDFDIENFNDRDSCIQSDSNPVINYLHSSKKMQSCVLSSENIH